MLCSWQPIAVLLVVHLSKNFRFHRGASSLLQRSASGTTNSAASRLHLAVFFRVVSRFELNYFLLSILHHFRWFVGLSNSDCLLKLL
jgi:hypothetical protein